MNKKLTFILTRPSLEVDFLNIKPEDSRYMRETYKNISSSSSESIDLLTKTTVRIADEAVINEILSDYLTPGRYLNKIKKYWDENGIDFQYTIEDAPELEIPGKPKPFVFEPIVRSQPE